MSRLELQLQSIQNPFAGILETIIYATARYVLASGVVTASVQFTMLPILIVYFHRVSVSSVLLNVLVGLLMAMLALVALTGLIVVQISTAVATPFFGLANALSWLMVHSVDPVTKLGIASTRIPEYSGWSSLIYLGYCLPLVAIAVAFSRWYPLGPRTLGTDRGVSRVTPARILAQVVLLGIVILHPLSGGYPTDDFASTFSTWVRETQPWSQCLTEERS